MAVPVIITVSGRIATYSMHFARNLHRSLGDGDDHHPGFIVNMLKGRVGWRDKIVWFLGMAFEADCDDTRDSLSFKLRHQSCRSRHDRL